jgi:hypothetical protein
VEERLLVLVKFLSVTVFRRGDDSVAFKGELNGRLYLVDFTSDKAQLHTCLLEKSSLSWLWHRQLAHVGMNNLNKLLKGGTHPRINKCSF